jgi:hypothetical protein
MKIWVALGAATALGACTPVSSSFTPFAPRPTPIKPAADACPLTLEGVRADIETTGRGVTITLASGPDQLMLLRARSRDVATMDGGLLAACPCPSASPMAPSPAVASADASPDARASANALPSADVAVEDTDAGVRIILTARDPSDAPRLANQVRRQLTLVHASECPKPIMP